jgi:hypothetical protein
MQVHNKFSEARIDHIAGDNEALRDALTMAGAAIEGQAGFHHVTFAQYTMRSVDTDTLVQLFNAIMRERNERVTMRVNGKFATAM